MPGISGLAVYLPSYRVQLQQWCQWNEQPWEKVRKVVGNSFRMRGPDQSVYTMAANAVWALIKAYDIHPKEVGYLALGTESSSDNAAGAVIVRGMIDDALSAAGMPHLARDCEVPEYKHACLGGMYATKGALRYLSTDGAGRKAIVVCADIAEYARGSSGEPTQGVGAVAMLLESEPKILSIDLAHAGSASAYRLADFRKPFARYRNQTERADGRLQDLPVFNGRHSTNCYIEATCFAVRNMLVRSMKKDEQAHERLQSFDAVFMHRPYHRMPQTGWGMARLAALATTDAGKNQLHQYCQEAELDSAALIAELTDIRNMRARLRKGEGDAEAYSTARQLVRYLRKADIWQDWVYDKLALGSEGMRELGNLYTAALPAWLAAGLAQATEEDLDLAGQEWLALGYGSGDAAEAWPMRVVDGWQQAAKRINFSQALGQPVDLTEQQYKDLHDGKLVDLPAIKRRAGFEIDRIGTGQGVGYDDTDIEYYYYRPRRQS